MASTAFFGCDHGEELTLIVGVWTGKFGMHERPSPGACGGRRETR